MNGSYDATPFAGGYRARAVRISRQLMRVKLLHSICVKRPHTQVVIRIVRSVTAERFAADDNPYADDRRHQKHALKKFGSAPA